MANLERVAGSSAPTPLACLRVRAMDLTICDGSALVLYTLRFTPTTLGWEQRSLAYPDEQVLWDIRDRFDWARAARRACSSTQVRVCRVAVGVVAAEARAAERYAELADAEEGVYRLSLAAAASRLALGRDAAKAARLMLADVERARHPSHVPVHPLQRALVEELALGRSLGALCSRSEHFSSADGTNLLCRRLGLLGARDEGKRLRYGRVVPYRTAERLCEVLDMAPEEVGL